MHSIVAAFLLVLLPLPGQAKEGRGPKELTLGIFPRESATKTVAAFTPLARHLEAKLGITVHLALSKDFPAFLERLDQGGFNLVHLNHAHYVRSRGPEGYEVIGSNR